MDSTHAHHSEVKLIISWNAGRIEEIEAPGLKDLEEYLEILKLEDPNKITWIIGDLKKERFIGIGGEVTFLYKNKVYIYPKGGLKRLNSDLQLLDLTFRKPGEIPEGYKWDEGEYAGWLQYRWGDGKNAIQHKPVKRLHTPMTKEELEKIEKEEEG